MAEKHFYEQRAFTRDYVLPFLKQHIPDFASRTVLEVGCAEAGFLSVLREQGMSVAGIELDEERVRLAKTMNPDLDVVMGDITDANVLAQRSGAFDVIVMREVIEHVPDREAAFSNLVRLLRKDGYLYITFPPRFSPFAGHQQVGRTILAKTPYLHYWPGFILKPVARWLNEYEYLIRFVLQNYYDGLTVRRFDRLCRRYNLQFIVRDLFLVRPIYQQRFGWRPRRFFNIPLLREVLVTGCECILRKRGD